jgi:hypothetical protein
MTGVPAADAVDRLTAVGADPRVYVIPDARLVFVAVNKNACTSLKWMVAGIAGENLNGFKAGLRTYTTDHEAVHNRTLWSHALTMKQVDPQVRAQIDPGNGWFIFGVVRDPRGRLFSAWQNKLLLENAGYTQWRKEPWYPRHRFDPESILADFAHFVDVLDRDPKHPLLRRDNHFKSQSRLLLLDSVPYSKIYNINEIGALRADVQAHLESVGHSAEFLLPSSNDTPLPANATVFAGGVREQVERIYADDFERFGDRWDFAKIESAREWTKADLAEAELRATLGRRIGDLRDRASQLRDTVNAEKARTAELEARVSELEQQLKQASTTTGLSRLRRRAGRLRRRMTARSHQA